MNQEINRYIDNKILLLQTMLQQEEQSGNKRTAKQAIEQMIDYLLLDKELLNE